MSLHEVEFFKKKILNSKVYLKLNEIEYIPGFLEIQGFLHFKNSQLFANTKNKLAVSFSDSHFKCSVILLTAAEHIILLWKSKQKASENTKYEPQWLHLVLLRRVGRIIQKYFFGSQYKNLSLHYSFFILFIDDA